MHFLPYKNCAKDRATSNIKLNYTKNMSVRKKENKNTGGYIATKVSTNIELNNNRNGQNIYKGFVKTFFFHLLLQHFNYLW